MNEQIKDILFSFETAKLHAFIYLGDGLVNGLSNDAEDKREKMINCNLAARQRL